MHNPFAKKKKKRKNQRKERKNNDLKLKSLQLSDYSMQASYSIDFLNNSERL